MKIAQGLSLMGDRGKWAIGQLDIDPTYRALLVDLLEAGGKFMKKNLSRQEKKAAHSGLVEALARAEVLLPLYFHTNTTHQLRHLGPKVVRVRGRGRGREKVREREREGEREGEEERKIFFCCRWRILGRSGRSTCSQSNVCTCC